MAGDWLKMDCSTPDKPEVLAITTRMGWDDPDLTVGKLFRVWRWFDQQTVDGNAKNVTAALLDRIAGVTGFAEAMQNVRWLVISDDGVALPSFDKHNGASAKNRVETARRVAKHRAKPESGDGEYVRLTVPRPIRTAVLARDGGACVYCSRKEGEYSPQETKRDGFLHLDHVIPLTRGGTDDLLNLVASCGPCNQFKADRTPDECGLRWPQIDGKRAGNTKVVTEALAREEKRREEERDSEANASGGKPPPVVDPKDVVFALGVTLLTAAGVKETNARSFLAMQCKGGREAEVADVLKACAAEKPIQPIPWIQDRMNRNTPKAGKHSGFGAKNYREGVTEDGSLA